jgi:hypothetical protein
MLFEDIRYALRQFLKTPGFTITAILTLALGIGATTAIFTLIHAVLLKSLPVAKPSELIRIGDNENCCINGGMQNDWSLFSTEQYREFRDHTQGFSNLAAFQAGRTQIGVRRVGSDHASEPYGAEFVSGNAFAMFGLTAWPAAAIGRSEGRAPGCGDELSDVAAEVRERSIGGWGDVPHQRGGVYRGRDWTAGVLWRAADVGSSLVLGSAERFTVGAGRQL